MNDHVSQLSPARIEERVAGDNFTSIVGPTISPGFNVFASGWGLPSAGLEGSEARGSEARASDTPGAYSSQPGSACLVKPLAIHLVELKAGNA